MKPVTKKKVDGVERIELPTPFPVGPVNVYLVQGEKLTLIDTGPNTAENFDLLKQELSTRGYSIHDLEQIVLTHHHVDHVGLLDRILLDNPVPVYGHPNCRVWLRQDKKFADWYLRFYTTFLERFGVPAELRGGVYLALKMMDKYSCHTDLDGELLEGDRVPGLPGWRVIETKGHAQSHISFYRASDKVLIGGDHIIKHISSNALIEPPADPDQPRVKPLMQYHENLIKCAHMPIDIVLSGHGEPVENVPQLVSERLNHAQKRAQDIKEIIQDGPKSGFEIVQALFPTKYQSEPMLTVSETAGHLDLLVERGDILEEEDNGILTYRTCLEG
ncbi:glyoxylase-like metal-dependent hydrolase (beta-lactamase superfamily II) [Caldalkalibacillus uzonensis]|uniref:Glyoxylase-like metal-dependent hydrolase (Beta-lactamase superfamily II) n=1 Tax=Caldalkalibacillus uzonensis TaxID=353224 RepID=A0ABU0CU75_9BACI|nr:MBL fold metallo-hydrolase [Caldalkalibacillus uzonensis]MDQ0339672.1 glyoxylase-like metal-dependent hydrolase (beta-lactamase superfamily II) [Caldalkalibacillus uzonensis]